MLCRTSEPVSRPWETGHRQSACGASCWHGEAAHGTAAASRCRLATLLSTVVAEREQWLAARSVIMGCCMVSAVAHRLANAAWDQAFGSLSHIRFFVQPFQTRYNPCAGSSVWLGTSSSCAAHRALEPGRGSAGQSQPPARVQDLCSLETAGSRGCCLHCRAGGTLCHVAQVECHVQLCLCPCTTRHPKTACASLESVYLLSA